MSSLMHFRGADQHWGNLQKPPHPSLHPSHYKTGEVENLMTLKQACSSEYQGAQGAFKDSMIHWILQFTLLIAFRCVLHRCESQEIRCWKLYSVYRHKAHWYILIHTMGYMIKRRPTWLDCSNLAGLQKVHRWKYKDDGRAHTLERASNNHIRFIQ